MQLQQRETISHRNPGRQMPAGDVPELDSEWQFESLLLATWPCGCRAALALRPKILSGIETEAADVAQATGGYASVSRPVCLRGIFDDDQFVTARHFDDRRHVRWVTVKMNRQNSLGTSRNRTLNRSGIKRERRRINVDEHCSCPNIANCAHAG